MPKSKKEAQTAPEVNSKDVVLNIVDVESKLGVTLKRNWQALGLDVAKNVTGVCHLKTDDTQIRIQNVSVIDTSKQECLAECMDKFSDDIGKTFTHCLTHEQSDQDRITCVIEDCWFGKNIQTVIRLAEFHALAYIEARKWVSFDNRYFLLPSTSRAWVGFKKNRNNPLDTKAQLAVYLQQTLGVTFASNDIADAFVLALCALCDIIVKPKPKAQKKRRRRHARKKYKRNRKGS